MDMTSAAPVTTPLPDENVITRHAGRDLRQANPGQPSTVVVGGGLAGIATALRLSAAGLPVTLVEGSRRLGGRATSFVDAKTNQVLDNCQHVLMGCCTNLRDLYRRLGVAGKIQWHRRLYFAGTDRRGRQVVDSMEADDLPAPLHLTRSLLAFRTLTPGEKFSIARGMRAILSLGPTQRRPWHDRSFDEWLSVHGQPRGAVEKFWSVVVVSALNEWPQRVAADYALQVFQDGFLGHEDAYVMGLPSVPLVQLYDAAQQAIEAGGGEVLLGVGAEAFECAQGRVDALRLGDGRQLRAENYVSAVPFDRLLRLCPPQVQRLDARLRGLDQIEVSPILGIHLWLAADDPGHPPMALPHLILTHGPLQWIFNKGVKPLEASGLEAVTAEANGRAAQHLHGVISAAHDLVDEPSDRLVEQAVAALREALPSARKASLLHARVIKEKRATFSARPGIESLRPAATGNVANLFLAGDYCRSGWPATMEGAVRSGYLAAAAIMGDGGGKEDSIVPGLERGALVRLLGKGGS